MRPYQIFAAMDPEGTKRFFGGLAEGSPPMFAQLVHAAAAAMKSRPSYLKKLPLDKQANAMRRALARVGADSLAEEMLAIYFLECRKELLTEWLDGLGIEHEEGSLKQDAPPQPDDAKLVDFVASFRSGEEPSDRELLMRAFTAQASIDWPALDAMLEG
jgi:hypothetical protein